MEALANPALGFDLSLEHDTSLCDKVLEAYFPNTRYLKSGVIQKKDTGMTSDLVSATCEFAIPESCYINDTGHFNSVEFNICYNQMMYYAIAMSVKHGLMSSLSHWDLSTYFAKQLPDILIVSFKSKFKKPINARSFFGYIDFHSSRVVKGRKSMLFMKTDCGFRDADGGDCYGSVDLAVVQP